VQNHQHLNSSPHSLYTLSMRTRTHGSMKGPPVGRRSRSCVPRSRNCISCVPSRQPQTWRVASRA